MGLFNPGFNGVNPPDAPSIPVPNLQQQAQEAAAGYTDAGIIDQFWAKATAHILPGVVAVLQYFVSIVDTVVASLLTIYSGIQGGKSPGTFTLAAAAVSDLLGVEVDAATIQAAFARGPAAAMNALGGAVMSQLQAELSPAGSTIQPQDGVNAAQTFLGYGLQFAIREGNLDFITSLIPEEYRVGEGLRGYGEGMARVLSLGRLSRLAFAPLFKIFIQDPSTWFYNQKYRPTLLGDAKAIEYFNRGLLSQSEFTNEMQLAGYSDRYAEVLQTAAYKQINEQQLYQQVKFGDIQEGQLPTLIQTLGYSQGDADTVVNTLQWTDAETVADQMANTAFTKALKGAFDPNGFQTYINNLPFGSTKQQWWGRRLADDLNTPRAFLTWSDVSESVIKGILTFDDATSFLQQAGYSATDQNTLMLLLLSKLDTDEAKAATAQFTYNLAVEKAKKAGTPIPPPPAGTVIGG